MYFQIRTQVKNQVKNQIRYPFRYPSLFPKLSLGIITLALSLTGCGSQPTATTENAPVSANPDSVSNPVMTTQDLPRVVVTHSVLCDITKEIAQTTVNLDCLIEAGTDPHNYQATPEDKRAIEQAKLILYGGYSFEPGLIKMITTSQSPATKVAVSEVAVPNPIKAEEHDHSNEAKGDDHDHDHDHEKETATGEAAKTEKAAGHDHGEFDPHVWHNAQYGVQMVQVVRDQLKTLSPENADRYTTNAANLTKKLQAIDTWIKAQVNTIPANQKKLVTTHESMGYFATAYGITLNGALQGITTEEQPTATRVAALVEDIKATKAPTVFPEANVNPGLMQVVAKEAQVKVADTPIFGDGLGAPGTPGDTYVNLLTSNTCTIVNGLGGKCTPFID
ncbi:MAG: zinc ABC transporter solute-binding protein [Coleofasciculaceae cyanobacterium SM2_1_6]|nr:zinc ABC transporter solute-binding protein [Coleofasciculaceae cyanobacterium SM2_1_6]